MITVANQILMNLRLSVTIVKRKQNNDNLILCSHQVMSTKTQMHSVSGENVTATCIAKFFTAFKKATHQTHFKAINLALKTTVYITQQLQQCRIPIKAKTINTNLFTYMLL